MENRITIDLREVFASSPTVYGLLILLSTLAIMLWLYSFLKMRYAAAMPHQFSEKVREKLRVKDYESALDLCQQKPHLFAKMIKAGITTRHLGTRIMIDAMESEGKRSSATYWQKIALLNDIGLIAPMVGLFGTVLGLFYAFYDSNRSVETISTLFDGLGVSVGTTMAGLIVAILAMCLHIFLKYRLVKLLTHVESEALSCALWIESEKTT